MQACESAHTPARKVRRQFQEWCDIPEGEETAEFAVPTRLLMVRDESDDPSAIAVTFPNYYFDGL